MGWGFSASDAALVFGFRKRDGREKKKYSGGVIWGSRKKKLQKKPL